MILELNKFFREIEKLKKLIYKKVLKLLQIHLIH